MVRTGVEKMTAILRMTQEQHSHFRRIYFRAMGKRQSRSRCAVAELLKFYDQAISSMDLSFPIPQLEFEPYLNNFVEINAMDRFRVRAAEFECDSKVGP